MPKQVLSATALALLIGVSTFTLNTALAQNGGEARNNDREMKKTLDDKHLTPIRPIRRVGDDNWPAAKDQPAPTRETSGQSAKTDEKKEPAKQGAKQEQDTAKQEPAKQNTAKQDAAKPEPKLEAAKQDEAKPDATKSTSTAGSKPDPKQQDTAKTGDQDKKDKGFASIRLGTDKDGRVAVNDAQEKQITKAIRKQHADTFNVKVSVGSVAPANVRLVAVSSDMIDVMPQFRGYNYFATSEEVVIVEPSTKKVVALIPVKLTATASRPDDERTTRTETRRTETRRDDTQRTEARTTSRTKERDITVGRGPRMDDVPSKEEILAAPVARGPAGTTVTRTYRTYQTYQYEEPADVVIIERRRPRIFGIW